MKTLLRAAAVAIGLVSAPAFAQPSELILNADPVPVIDVTIGNQPARLEVGPDVAGQLFLGPRAADRLRVTKVPYPRALVTASDGDGAIRARLGVQHVRFANGVQGPRTIVMPSEASDVADGVIGLPALPYEIITINLRPSQGDERDIAFPLRTTRSLFPRVSVGGQDLWLSFSFRRDLTLFNRAAAAALDGAGGISAEGALISAPVFPGGLTAMVQPVRTTLALEGLALAPAAARTNSPLMGPIGPDDVVVEAQIELPPPGVSLGRTALARCSSIRIDRPAQRFTLRCSPT